jgi:UDP:flavonoid glycosyltransferase YjiC (YdhE family)
MAQRPRILITLGTFLSARKDVLRRCINGARRAFPDSLILASAGTSREALIDLEQEGVIIEEFLPQVALLPHMDVLIYHGGNNSFTEGIAAGCRMIILPFSSDQFEIAADAEREEIAAVLDPNRFDENDLGEALAGTLEKDGAGVAEHWKKAVAPLGPRYAVDRMGLT